MKELKPCPFCGGRVNVYYSSSLKSHYVDHIERGQECWVLMPLLIKGAVSLADARDKWNRRVKE